MTRCLPVDEDRLREGARRLARVLKLSFAGCHDFLRQTSLVARGLRQACLIDTLSLTPAALPSVSDILQQVFRGCDSTILCYEEVTAQAFAINVRLFCTERAMESCFVDPIAKTVVEDYARVWRVLTHLRNELQKYRNSPTFIFNLQDPLYGAVGDSNIRQLMISLAGVLLEYPFIYLFPKGSPEAEAEKALHLVDLLVLRLDIREPEGSTTLLQCSVPAAIAHRLGDFDQRLEKAIQRYAARAGGEASFVWVTEEIRLDRVAL